MNITSAQYVIAAAMGETQASHIDAIIDGVTTSVPLDSANRHYAEIMRQVEAGELVIQEADNG